MTSLGKSLKRCKVWRRPAPGVDWAQQWKAALLEEIYADQLPVHYGDTKINADGNPLCLDKVRLLIS